MIVHIPPAEMVATLRRRMTRLEGARGEGFARAEEGVSRPDRNELCAAFLGALLPQGGLARGSLVEWLAAGVSSGAPLLALLAARDACREGKALMVVDRGRQFYPPAAAAWGIDLTRLVVVQPANDADELWAIDQALRCRGVGAVWARRGRLDARDFRRLQLAAESGGTLGLLVRPASVRGEPSWAHVQILVSTVGQTSSLSVHSRSEWTTCNWRLRVELTRCHSGNIGQAIELEIDERTGNVGQVESLSLPTFGQVENLPHVEGPYEAHSVRPAAELAHPAVGRRPARAARRIAAS